MPTLYLDRKHLSLHLEGGAIAVHGEGGIEKRIPLGLVDRMVVSASCSLTTSLILALASRGAALVVLDPRDASRAAILAAPPGPDAARRLVQARRFSSEEWRREWSRRLVLSKVRGQIRLLAQASADRPDARYELKGALATLWRIRTSLQTEREAGIDRMRGMEGAASAAYFSGFTRLFAPALRFEGRNRRPPRDPVNAVLSLAYTLLHAAAVREIRGTGLDPYLGYYHEPEHGRESLACDLIEPLRPLADGFAWRLFRERKLRREHFQESGKACLLGKAGRATFYAAFEAPLERCARTLRRLARATVRSLGDAPEAGPREERHNEETPVLD